MTHDLPRWPESRPLTRADRDLFRLRCQSDLPIKDLACQLGRPASTVYNAVNRIRRLLADCVQQKLTEQDGA
jgi:DNA-directed RNA polymerase specialized sigma24 family protein